MEFKFKVLISFIVFGLSLVVGLLGVNYFQPETYTITYVDTIGTTYKPIVYEGEINLNLPESNVEGYDFLGWFKDGEKISNGVYSESMTLFARYDIHTYEIKLYDETSETYEYEYQELLNLPVPLKDGQRFLGWYDAANDELFTDEKATKDVILYAKYESIEPTDYLVYFVSPFSGLIESLEIAMGEGIEIPEFFLEGYQFNGFMHSDTLEKVESGDVLNENSILIADLEPSRYTLSFEVVPMDPIEIIHGQEVILPVPEKSGYVFKGWYEDNNLTTPYTNRSDESLTLYPYFQKLGRNNFAHYLISEFDGLISEVVVERNEGVSLPTLSKRGYDFVGWKLSGTDTFVSNGDVINENAVLLAVFESEDQEFQVTFNTGNSDPIDPITIKSGDVLTLPEEPNLFGYQFKGWVTDIEFDGFNLNSRLITENFVVTEDMTLFANFDYMIPGDSIFYQPYIVYGEVLGYAISNITYNTDEVIEYMILPQTYLGLPVVGIIDGAFEDLDYLKEVVIPEGYIELTKSAFEGSSIETVHIPASLEIIDDEAFQDSQIKEVIFAEESNLRSIGLEAFYNTSQLKSINIPDSVRIIGEEAFEDSGLESVSFGPNSELFFIGDQAFRDTYIQSIELPNSLEMIDEDAFRNSLLTSITLPENLLVIGTRAFQNTQISEITIMNPTGLLKLENNIFYGTPQLFQEGVLSVSGIIFGYDENLNTSGFDLVIEEDIFMIVKSAFYDAKINSLVFETDFIRSLETVFEYSVIEGSFTLPNSNSFNGAFRSADLNGTFELVIPSSASSYQSIFSSTDLPNVDIVLNSLPENTDASSMFSSVEVNKLTLGEEIDRLYYYMLSNADINELVVLNNTLELENRAFALSSLNSYSFPDNFKFIPQDSDPFGDIKSNSIPFKQENGYKTFENVLFDVNLSVASPDFVIPDGINVINQTALVQNFESIDFNDTEYLLYNALQTWSFSSYTHTIDINLTDKFIYIDPDFLRSFNTRSNQINIEGFNDEVSEIHNNIARSSQFYRDLPFDENGFKRIGNMIYDYDIDNFPSDVIIPKGVTHIARNTFDRLGITSITALSEIEYVGYDAYSNNENLQNIIFPTQDLNEIIYVNYEESELSPPRFDNFDGIFWSNFESVDMDSFTSYFNVEPDSNGLYIHEGILYAYDRSSKNVIIPEGVVAIYDDVFSFSLVESITLPSTLVSIGEEAFSYTPRLKDVIFDSSLVLDYIGDQVIYSSLLRFSDLPNALETGEIYESYSLYLYDE